MRRFLLLCSLVLMVCACFPAGSAVADESSSPSITVSVDTVVYGDPGSVHELASAAVDASLQGSSCTVTAVASNNESTHPNSNLTVASGVSSAAILDVESSPDKVTDGDGTLVLGTQLTVSVTLGGDGVFSGGVEVTVTCQSPPPTTTEPPTTTSPPPTTTVPVGPIVEVTTAMRTPPVAVAAAPVPAQPQTTG